MDPRVRRLRQNFPKLAIAVGAFLVIAVLGGVSFYFYSKYQEAQKQIQAPTVVSDEASRQIIASIGKLIDLPMDEEPTVATITNVEQLRDQPFFKKAKNGDNVLIYTKAGKAILYRPGINKIIDVSPINISDNASGSAEVAGAGVSPTQPPLVLPSPTPFVAEDEASGSSIFAQ